MSISRLVTRTSSFAAHGVLLSGLCLVFYLPGLASIPPVDRDEARFAQATRQMLATGDFVRPQFQQNDRFKKPVGIYWLQSLSAQLASRPAAPAIWPYRIPSVVGGILAVLLTWYFGRLLCAPAAALLGAALLGGSLLTVTEAHLATTDAALLACIVGAQGCLAMLYRATRRGRIGSRCHAAGFWLAQGLGFLLKGPVAPLASGLTIVALMIVDRRAHTSAVGHRSLFKQLRPQWGVPLLLLLILPWTIAIAQASGGKFFEDWFNGDLLPKLIGGQESHGAPPGFHLLLLGATFWPGSFALGLTLLHGRRRRQRWAERFCLAWIVPFWIFFELLPTKLPHYVLPTFPALALLTGRALLSAASRRRPSPAWLHAGLLLWFVLGIALGVATLALPSWLQGRCSAASVIGALALAAGAWEVWWRASSMQWRSAAFVALTAAALWWVTSLQWVLPGLDRLWLSRMVADAIRQRRTSPLPVASIGYQEPSLVFLVGTDLSLLTADEGASFLLEHNGALALVSEDETPAFERAARARAVEADEIWSGEGLNYSKGRMTRLHLYRSNGAVDVASDGQADPSLCHAREGGHPSAESGRAKPGFPLSRE